MATNSATRRIAQKEIRLFFSSAVAWLFLASFAAATLFTFFWVESFFARNIADVRPLFEWMPILLIILCAALTMSMWSEERHSGTLEHVLTQPVSVWSFVFGKFWACFTLLLLALVSTLSLPITIALLANLDWGPVVGGYIATILLGASYLAIGLFVSARTDNPIVSMIGTIALCSVLYLLGSATFTGFFEDQTSENLRLLGSGARFESITRGIIDLRDLFYYFSLCVGFLALNAYTLTRERWLRNGTSADKRRNRSTAIVLLLANLLVANIWLSQLSALRIDLTEGRLFSISQPTKQFLNELQEPLLIRGYFSARTHPLLAPLVPQLRDLLLEYELAGNGKVEVEFLDPADDPEIEHEANERYGITATPFQIADRHQSALVNAYFNILVRYGSEHQTLGFGDLIEVRSAPNAPAEVLLRNPEYDITHAIKKALFDYRSGGDLFAAIEQPVELIGYVSADELLPEQLQAYKRAILPQLELAAKNSNGKFSVRFIEPESLDGALAARLKEQWGFKPMVASLDDPQEFYFYLTLTDSQQFVQLPTEQFQTTAFRLMLDAGLKRFAPGLTKIVALALPQPEQQQADTMRGGPSFTNLERAVTRDYSIRLEDLSDGSVAQDADILAVVAPNQLDAKSVYAIDQYLMRGGTVVVASSPFVADIGSGEMRLQPRDSGLALWLAHHGLEIEKTLVLDQHSTSFSAPVNRQSGDYEFRDLQMVDYPYFIDLRPPGLTPGHAVTSNLPQVTMAWASPIVATPTPDRRISVLLKSSAESWLSPSRDVMPGVDANGVSRFRPPADKNNTRGEPTMTARNLGVVAQGRFVSYFANRANPLTAADASAPRSAPDLTTQLQRSPESARIVLYASNDFISDRVLNSLVTATGTQYLGPLALFLNTLDWALQDEQLLNIRSRAHFNRTLPPMERQTQQQIEYLNYGIAVLWLLLLAFFGWLQLLLRRRHYTKGLAL